jgi:hypothetical protein|tara:strand:- start:286 stop:633 length:348 start_codon:yes stop_codon:yes gene_type:complete
MAVTLAQVSADTGEVYDAVDGGTTAVTAIIARALNFVTAAGSTDDAIVRPLTDAMVVNQVMGGIDPVNKTIGTLSVGNKDLKSMRDYFKKEANMAAVVSGVSLDGLTIILQDSEQ